MSVKAVNMVPSALLTITADLYYTVPASTSAIIQKMTVVNVDTTPRTVTVYLVPSGGSAVDGDVIVKTLPVPANLTLDIPEAFNHVLKPGDSIRALASLAATLVFRVSGVEIV